VIRIKKPTQAPAVLQSRGSKATQQLCAEYDGDPRSRRRWKFDSKLYGAKSVKAALQKAQHDKCAFCESKISHIAYGDVEHFRPKAGYRQKPTEPIRKPGYYWLAYDWTNLLFCCQICNQRNKGNHFPLINDANRARSHHDDIKHEQPLFINPADEDPREFLEFREEYVCATDGNSRGAQTIDVLGLNRELIAERRGDLLAKLKILIVCREQLKAKPGGHPDPLSKNHIAMINAHLERCASDSAEYAAMVRALLKNPMRTST
jgi:uncharacterized protein (TIGR02646 family)